MADDNDESKEFEPSQRKLDEARKRGDVPKSTDLTTAAAQAGLLLCLLAVGLWSVRSIGNSLENFIGDPSRLGGEIFAGGAQAITAQAFVALLGPLAPWFVIPAGLALISLVAQQAVAFSGEKLQPKLSRIDPLSNAKQKFGMSGLMEFAKSAIKLLLIGVFLTYFLIGRMPQILATSAMPARQGLVLLGETLAAFLTLAVCLAATIGGFDLIWQRYNHRRKLMMSRKELMDEMKQSEGDPHLKQQRRQRGYDIATNRMLQEVPEADVVVVNPEHYAVALKWSRAPGSAPICVAKGVDEVAARIREAATTCGVPIHRDPPTARALHATVALGDPIAPEHYQAVAAAIRFAEEMRKRVRRGG